MRILKTCPHCEGRGYISRFENNENECRAWSEKCVVCEGTGSILSIETNADHIRAMSDKELAKFLYRYFWGREKDMPIAKHRIAEWLQQPAEEDS